MDAPVADFAREEDGDYYVLPENWQALELFLLCQEQWHRAGLEGMRVGLDYLRLEAVMRMEGIKDQRAEFRRVREIEAGALEAMQEKRDTQ